MEEKRLPEKICGMRPGGNATGRRSAGVLPGRESVSIENSIFHGCDSEGEHSPEMASEALRSLGFDPPALFAN